MLNEINLARADLNLLTLFEAVLRERHVGRAAMRLNLTPSAVSHGLGRLRRQLNDPLFLRTPKGVVPTARAMTLATPIADLLARARNVLASAAPFDATTSTRRFVIGAPDSVSSVFLTLLLAKLQSRAPGIDIGLRQLLPTQGGHSVTEAWTPILGELEAGLMDIAVAPIDRPPPRFAARTIYEEDFVAVARARHPFAARPTLARYCEAQHLVVSMTADRYGFVDEALAKQGLSRRVALTVPNFASGLAAVAETDLIAAMPRRFVAMHARRFGVVGRELPLKLRSYSIRATVPRAALMDEGIVWLIELMGEAVGGARTPDAIRRV
jgi:DNA-binding transcriptional LysR family regulator